MLLLPNYIRAKMYFSLESGGDIEWDSNSKLRPTLPIYAGQWRRLWTTSSAMRERFTHAWWRRYLIRYGTVLSICWNLQTMPFFKTVSNFWFILKLPIALFHSSYWHKKQKNSLPFRFIQHYFSFLSLCHSFFLNFFLQFNPPPSVSTIILLFFSVGSGQ